jgi:hypothetical protein
MRGEFNWLRIVTSVKIILNVVNGPSLPVNDLEFLG